MFWDKILYLIYSYLKNSKNRINLHETKNLFENRKAHTQLYIKVLPNCFPNVSVGANCLIKGHWVLGNSRLVIGTNVSFRDNTYFSCKESILIGSNTFFADNIYVSDNNSHTIDAIGRLKLTRNPPGSSAWSFLQDDVLSKPINIGNNVWIGRDVIILKGVSIGDNSIVGAGSVVTKSFPEGSIIGGNPARLLKNL
jgi:acetyltransferase-like isoleucine patch superfamily enzyme